MNTISIHSCVAHMRRRVQLSRKVVRDLKKISDLSSKNRWEYAGKFDVKFENNTFSFSEPTIVTSRDRHTVTVEMLERVWPSPLTYHTHPSVTRPVSNVGEVFLTLPSNQDFNAFILGYPEMQANVICDAHGYYLIDILGSIDKYKLPLPEAVHREMKEFRKRPFLREHVFSEDRLEYYQATLKDWKHLINYELNYRLTKLFGICIRYYGYNESPPTIIVDV